MIQAGERNQPILLLAPVPGTRNSFGETPLTWDTATGIPKWAAVKPISDVLKQSTEETRSLATYKFTILYHEGLQDDWHLQWRDGEWRIDSLTHDAQRIEHYINATRLR